LFLIIVLYQCTFVGRDNTCTHNCWCIPCFF